MVGIDKQKAAVVLTGPPATRDLDSDVVRQLMQTGSTRIVCGGTTSKIVSNYTRSPVHVDLTTATTEIPPIARIEGLDLVTEGIVTLTRVRDMLAERAIETELAWLCGWSDSWYFSQREKIGSPPPSTAALREKTAEAGRTKALMDVMGLYGQLQRESKWAKLSGRAERQWQIARSTHPAGTIEVNKIVLAGRGLGLPRVPAQFNKQIMEALKEKGSG